MSALRTVATLRKNGTQEIRVTVAAQEGYSFVDVRVFEAAPRSRGEPKATKSGVCIVSGQLPALIEALQVAEREMSR